MNWKKLHDSGDTVGTVIATLTFDAPEITSSVTPRISVRWQRAAIIGVTENAVLSPNDIHISPSPVTAGEAISIVSMNATNVAMIDMLGRVVHTTANRTASGFVLQAPEESGVYAVKISNAKGTSFKTVVVMR